VNEPEVVDSHERLEPQVTISTDLFNDLSSREREAEQEAQTAVDLDSTNFQSHYPVSGSNGPTYLP